MKKINSLIEVALLAVVKFTVAQDIDASKPTNFYTLLGNTF